MTNHATRSRPRLGLPKSERLRRKADFDTLVHQGDSLKLRGVRLVWLFSRAETGLPGFQLAVTAPKKLYKRAHDRNHAKRQLREAWRTQCTALREWLATQPTERAFLRVLLVYTYRPHLPTDQVFKSVRKGIRLLMESRPDPPEILKQDNSEPGFVPAKPVN